MHRRTLRVVKMLMIVDRSGLRLHCIAKSTMLSTSRFLIQAKAATHTPTQYARHHFGSCFSSHSLSVFMSLWMSIVYTSPCGQFNESRSNCFVWGLILASAVTPAHSSQYHHFSLGPAHGGNSTQENTLQDLQGVDTPSPCMRIVKDAIIMINVTMIPKN